MTIIGNFRREAALAEQCRLARAGRPGRNFVRSFVNNARLGITEEPAARTESMSLATEVALIK